MGSITKKAMQDKYVQQYVEAIWSERLKQAGFTCPDEKMLCWYRVVNKEIIHSIYFYTKWSGLPVELEVRFSAYPLFYLPEGLKHVCSKDEPEMYSFERERSLKEDGAGMAEFSEEILVYAPRSGSRGGYVLDSILPWLDQVTSIEECYKLYRCDIVDKPLKRHYLYRFPLSFIELALFFEDAELYDECICKSKDMVKVWSELCEKFPKNQKYPQILQGWNRVLNALQGDDRKAFLQHLEQRKQKTLQWLEKMGIPV